MVYRLLLICLAVHLLLFTAQGQNSTLKKVTLTVVDAGGKPVEGAEVAHKGVFKKQKKITDAQGKVTFEIYIVLTSVQVYFEVKSINAAAPFKTVQANITVTSDREFFDLSTSVQLESRQVKVKLVDEKNQALPNTRAILSDANGSQATAVSDNSGTATFNVSPGSFKSSDATLTLERPGYEKYISPVNISAPTTITALMQRTTSSGEATSNVTGMMQKAPGSSAMMEPTNNVMNTIPNEDQRRINNIPAPVWGPYTPLCDKDPVPSVPEFNSHFVKDEQDLLDYFAESCLGSGQEAFDSIAALYSKVQDIATKIQAAIRAKQATQSALDVAKDVVIEDGLSFKKSFEEAHKKSKAVVDNMKKFAAGPTGYIASCFWEGFVNYGVAQLPEDLQKVKKSAESFSAATEEMQAKLERIQGVISKGKLTQEDVLALHDWSKITKGINQSAEALGILLAYVKDPKKLLPYEIQLSSDIEAIELMMGALLTDCQISDCDRRLRNAVSTGQQALMATRKYYAQMRKGEMKWKEKIYQSTRNYNFTHYTFDPGVPHWDQWAMFHNEAIKADQKRELIQRMLVQLSDLCSRLEPIAKTLNERVNKYERMYAEGLTHIAGCKLAEADNIAKQLRSLESSNCGHFFPAPYGKTKSAELTDYITKARKDNQCNKQDKSEINEKVVYKFSGVKIARQSKTEKGAGVDVRQWSYSATSGSILTISDPPYRVGIKWEFSGMPGGDLKGGEEITITVNGTLDIDSDRDLQPYASGGVTIYGFQIVSQMHGYLGAKDKREGKYVLRAPKDGYPDKIVFELWGDYGISTFAIYEFVREK